MASSHDDTWSTSPLVVKGSSTNSCVQSVNSRIGRDCHFKGALELCGSTQIDGSVEGDIFSQGEVVISETGIVNGRISTERIKVFGQVVGDISCTESLEFHTGARIRGDIQSPSVAIHDGVLFEGRCSMPAPEEACMVEDNVVRMSTDSEAALQSEIDEPDRD
jgi:cytoskeletal protein CcmA (bactofilin family)